ncbi:hypothetical protein [Nocardiopsis sp. FR4]|uniref:hypothetical protein n=1 Tax=Nocardiopsis sp. FR4 TaxID=2605985 RepID=UPI001357508F|nr:hypothetical protein [Nocardiopsis sp. FR4]
MPHTDPSPDAAIRSAEWTLQHYGANAAVTRLHDTPTSTNAVDETAWTPDWPYSGDLALFIEENLVHLYLRGQTYALAAFDFEDLEGLVPQAIHLLRTKERADKEERERTIHEYAEKLHASYACHLASPEPCITCKDYATAFVNNLPA